MTFIQTISFTASRIDEIRAAEQEFEGTGPAPGLRASKILKDRDRENAYMVIAEFDDYEVAMENSARPETDAFAKKMSEMVDGPVEFRNYDVIAE